MKKHILLLILLVFLTACGSNGGDSAAGVIDLNGTWKQKDASDDSWQEAVIQDDYIEIYWVSDNGDTRMLYWAGSVDTSSGGKEAVSWTSANDKEKTDLAMLASGDDTKVFEYKNNTISYSVSVLGTAKTIKLEKEKSEGTFVFGGKSAGFNETSLKSNTNVEGTTDTQTVSVDGNDFIILSDYLKETETSNNIVYSYGEKDSFENMLQFNVGDELTVRIPRKTELDEIVEELITSYGDLNLSNYEEIDIEEGKGHAYNYVGKISGEDAAVNISFLMRQRTKPIVVTNICVGDMDFSDAWESYIKVLKTAKWSAVTTTWSEMGESSSEKSVENNSESVTPSFKETMDKYEAFFDEYVAFMKSYQENPMNALSMLSEYTDMLTKYTEFYTEMSQLNTSNLPPADLAYYIEVTARIEKKLLEVVDY